MTQATQPLVSIIVPVYNVERYVDECIASIRAQTYAHLEILLVEDCSTDGSLKALESHLEDPRVRLIRHERNGGLSAARNTGIEASAGDYVLFVDSDDAISSTLVAACVANAVAMRADVVVFGFVAFQDGEPLPQLVENGGAGGARRLQGSEYFKLPHFAWLKFICRDLLEDPRLRFPVGLYYEDWPFHWELGFAAPAIYMLQERSYCYRQRGTSITASLGRKLLDQFRVQEVVLEVVRDRGGQSEARVLSAKAHTTFWAVLTRLDTSLVVEGVAAAKRLRGGLLRIASTPQSNVRGLVMANLLSLPTPLSIVTIRLVRGMKKVVWKLSELRGGHARRENT